MDWKPSKIPPELVFLVLIRSVASIELFAVSSVSSSILKAFELEEALLSDILLSAEGFPFSSLECFPRAGQVGDGLELSVFGAHWLMEADERVATGTTDGRYVGDE